MNSDEDTAVGRVEDKKVHERAIRSRSWPIKYALDLSLRYKRFRKSNYFFSSSKKYRRKGGESGIHKTLWKNRLETNTKKNSMCVLFTFSRGQKKSGRSVSQSETQNS